MAHPLVDQGLLRVTLMKKRNWTWSAYNLRKQNPDIEFSRRRIVRVPFWGGKVQWAKVERWMNSSSDARRCRAMSPRR
jgi:hypothetical protein